MARMKPLTVVAFRRWLKVQKSSRRFRACDGCACPIAQYLGNGYKVGTTMINPVDDGKFMGLPPWARLFISAFDSDYEYVRPPSKYGALAVLDRVAPEA